MSDEKPSEYKPKVMLEVNREHEAFQQPETWSGDKVHFRLVHAPPGIVDDGPAVVLERSEKTDALGLPVWTEPNQGTPPQTLWSIVRALVMVLAWNLSVLGRYKAVVASLEEDVMARRKENEGLVRESRIATSAKAAAEQALADEKAQRADDMRGWAHDKERAMTAEARVRELEVAEHEGVAVHATNALLALRRCTTASEERPGVWNAEVSGIGTAFQMSGELSARAMAASAALASMNSIRQQLEEERSRSSAGRVGELEERLAASEARVVKLTAEAADLERQIDEVRKQRDENRSLVDEYAKECEEAKTWAKEQEERARNAEAELERASDPVCDDCNHLKSQHYDEHAGTINQRGCTECTSCHGFVAP